MQGELLATCNVAPNQNEAVRTTVNRQIKELRYYLTAEHGTLIVKINNGTSL
jgi:hypothetical protein